ncbi:hypothetical protein [Nitrosomonas eutropha]|uniref:PDZ domain-containing protein n=2 Tax=Nitrosomonas eutropha TaxID=916 RepID=A0ABX5M6M4_9PROT|nr:hypothetical protein [Nitrosomonas eutropha]ABI60571.1 conserved hypothetical protein [Nitrosomonas eutropha C91]PXV73284.1 hypothetical protein C8R14_1583 [Nitrosomonas eutropha]SCX22354.1 hypothetical protein SAMN05216379_11847 [Nitrosomonas eutropha]
MHTHPIEVERGNESAVSWSAVFAGSAATAILSLILLILGSGLGLSVVSPWTDTSAVGVGAASLYVIIWVVLSSLLAAGLGGYLAGRLRVKWPDIAKDEIFFRDTAHGFLSWAVSSLVTAVLLATAVGSVVHGTIQMSTNAAVTTSAVAGSTVADSFGSDNISIDYFIDSLFRKSEHTTNTDVASKETNAKKVDDKVELTNEDGSSHIGMEVTRIFVNSIQSGNIETEDLNYVSEVISQHTGLTHEQAKERVKTTFSRIQMELEKAETALKETADQVRKASSYMALWIFISLLSGAFVASVAAIYGGRQRDAA